MDQSTPNRPRTQSRVSAWSHRSDGSKGSKPKDAGPAESPADKKRRDSFWKGGSKANPNAAIEEAQPGDAAFYEKATIEPLRSVEHKDRDGNVIAEPDLSNPTRSRWERPLDTIRSFDSNIEAGYKRRSVGRSESHNPREQYASRRNSYYNSHDARSRQSNSYNGGYYGSSQGRADGYQDDGSSPLAPPSRNRFNQRMGGTTSRSQSSYGMNSPQGYNNHDSYEAGMASDSTGPWNYSTDPSSENSSIDRAHHAAAANGGMHPSQQMDGYAYNDGLSYNNGAPIMEEYDSGSDGYGTGQRRQNRGPAPPNGHASQAPAVRAPIKLGGSAAPLATVHPGGSIPTTSRTVAQEEKKKGGFFKKRFSKG